MRQGFKKNLREYGSLAKKEAEIRSRPEGEDLDKDISRFEAALEYNLEEAARSQKTLDKVGKPNLDVQKKIYEMQQQKQEIVSTLKAQLACIDDPDCIFEWPEDYRKADYDVESGKFSGNLKQGEVITRGSIITDMDWDVYYALDKGTTPRDFMKRYFVEIAKKQLRELLDRQIVESELRGELSDDWKKHAYHEWLKGQESGVQQSIEETRGFVAEVVVKNILRTLEYDFETPFEIVEADVYQDVEQKLDFIIHLVDRNRGVDVRADDKRKDVGIQFTLNEEAVKHKTYQISQAKKRISPEWRIDDIALVYMPMNPLRDAFKKWEKDGRPSGGPANYFSIEYRDEIIRKLLLNLIPSDEISQYLKASQSVAGSPTPKSKTMEATIPQALTKKLETRSDIKTYTDPNKAFIAFLKKHDYRFNPNLQKAIQRASENPHRDAVGDLLDRFAFLRDWWREKFKSQIYDKDKRNQILRDEGYLSTP